MKQVVYLVDDDSSARGGLSRMIRIHGYEVEAFESANDFLAAWDDKAESCIVLDAMMPGMTGPELQESLLKLTYHPPIIFISAHGDVPITAHVMKKGAMDFLTKPVDAVDLLEAIDRALAKDRERHAELVEMARVRERLSGLTPREFEIMTYVIAGFLNKQIAYELDISEKTVKVHRGRIMAKTGVHSVAELVRLTNKFDIHPAEHSS